MWGQAVANILRPKEFGIIPTRVGTRTFSSLYSVIGKDHPHACGDKQALDKAGVSYDGSSPRVWGQVFFGIPAITAFGIIPTRVGTSSKAIFFRLSVRDHPHACGDKGILSAEALRLSGSSPRVWGQVIQFWAITMLIRIIPTRVGTSYNAEAKNDERQDHPHACGDKR